MREIAGRDRGYSLRVVQFLLTKDAAGREFSSVADKNV